MTVATKKQKVEKKQRLRTSPARGLASVDRAAKVILGYSVISAGEALGHGVEIDAQTLSKIVELGNAAGDRGIKTRFTHPDLSNDGLGKLLGRTKNFRVDGNRVRGDLHLSPRAFDTPEGDLGTYTLNLAESDPDMFGASIVVTMEREHRLNPDGTRQRDEDGELLLPLMRPLVLWASDVVDDPAANEDGFFAAAGDDTLRDFPARQATALLDRLFGDAPAEEVRSRVGDFVSRYLTHKGGPMASSEPKEPKPAETKPAETKPSGTPAEPAGTPAPAATAKPAETTTPALAVAVGELRIGDGEIEAARAAERKRAGEILALCKTAGHAELADRCIGDANLSVEDVRKQLFEAICKERKTVGDEAGNDQLAKPDPDAEFRKEFAADRETFARFAVSEEDYIRTRRRDKGLPVEPRAKATAK